MLAKKANAALNLCVASFILPALIWALSTAFFEGNKQGLEKSLFFLFLSLQIGAVILGLAAWEHQNAKIALVIAIILAIAITILLFLPATSSITNTNPPDSTTFEPAKTVTPTEEKK